MAKINILDSSIYNRIAAGEVVDRPYSVVKELVENSLDAHAKNITVAIERGGKDLICVTDDGDGIEKSELRAAFLPHATSKIAKVEDLDDIRTLGFRGEAIASIASVSRMRIRSRARGAEEAFELSCAGGTLGEVSPCPLGEGTEISVENLFYNTPVRERFLRTDKGEEAEISSYVSRFVLGNPQVSFRYYIGGKLALQSFGGGEEEAVAAVYGGAAVQQCYRIDAVKHGIRLHGYLGKPSFTKPNRTYQSVFVNGRYVVNNTIASAIGNAYGGYLMKRQYPFYVLFVDVPPAVVDVNVHPNKADVRFENNQVIYGCVYSVVSAVLDGNAAALDFVVGAKDAAAVGEDFPKQEDTPKMAEISPSKLENGSEIAKNAVLHSTVSETDREKDLFAFAPPSQMRGGERAVFHDSGAHPAAPAAEKTGLPFPEAAPAGGAYSKTSPADAGAFAASPGEDIFAENKRFLEEQERMAREKAKQQKFVFENAVYKGSLFNTYLIYEEGDNAYIIDQHAAHERLIFDRLKAEMEARKVVSQPMLVPYILTLNREEGAFFAEHLATIRDIGFDIEEFGGGSFKISAVPLDLQDIDLSAFFADVLAEVGTLRAIKLSELLRDKLAMTACKHAVKGGMLLTDAEQQALFAMLHGDMGLKCPHGRPVAVRMTKAEIEKLFKRIV
ncbi:MAG TPA: DNA mismatch repair endonuclease MutL [Candidatus Borkfalkia faecavium]|uniref:DNA mismatch repair protein MutL n=1 Tax=Candidatus Borkfalkia faecavium TaxID=2838508 RepID=A0A9D1W1D0_9FIRM|nr:DNA mismatch repair endonuclease MutL [Candidatus Borkfalkia faecavium]